jgi:hypothetical protein
MSMNALLIALAAYVVVLLGVRFLLFLGACALADVQPSLLKAALVSTAITVVMVGVMGAATAVLAMLFPFVKPLEPTVGSSLLIQLVTLVGVAVLAWPVYLFALPTSLGKSLQIAGWEQGLLALLNTLLAAVFLIGLALYQLFTYKPA